MTESFLRVKIPTSTMLDLSEIKSSLVVLEEVTEIMVMVALALEEAAVE
jgi:hypothetical protein